MMGDGGLTCPTDDLKVMNVYVVWVLSSSPVFKSAARTVGGSVKGSCPE